MKRISLIFLLLAISSLDAATIAVSANASTGKLSKPETFFEANAQAINAVVQHPETGKETVHYALVFNLANATGNFVLKGLNGSTGALFFKFNTRDAYACLRPSGVQIPTVYYIKQGGPDMRRWVKMSNSVGIPRQHSLYTRSSDPVKEPLGVVLVIRGLEPNALHQWSVSYLRTDKYGNEESDRTTTGIEIYHPVFPQLIPENLAPNSP